jgi:tRNA (cmo5U34)-methyltransferase
MADPPVTWSEGESLTYRSLARYAMPERERQVAIITALVVAAEAEGDVLDLCCGEGLLTEALLQALPDRVVHAYDGSQSMLDATCERAGGTDRLVTRRIDLAARDWRHLQRSLRAAVSSLAIHHLDDAGKRRLFADLHAALAPGGVFVLADVVRPARAVGHAIAAELWYEEVKRRALAQDGTLAGFEAFQRADWNHFRHAGPDPIDQPSTLVEQLDWLRAAGFTDLDLHWMTAGQVIVSGWRP